MTITFNNSCVFYGYDDYVSNADFWQTVEDVLFENVYVG